jgi:hypothetical protein
MNSCAFVAPRGIRDHEFFTKIASDPNDIAQPLLQVKHACDNNPAALQHQSSRRQSLEECAMAARADEQSISDIINHCANRSAITTGFADVRPISINHRTLDSDRTAHLVADDYYRHGYAHVRCDPVPHDGARLLTQLAEWLGVGAPFVPALYAACAASSFYDDVGVNVIAVAPNAARGSHPAFGSSDALELHTDGTLEPIGRVRTAALYCVTSAVRGGHTTLFDAAGAFIDVARRDSRSAAALLHEEALTRRATVGPSPQAATGPVFALWDDGEVISRYSATPRDEWAVDRIAGLREARRAMEERARPGSPFYAEVALAAGDGILIANDRLAHGRTAFVDRADAPRRMLRALFLDRPFCPTAASP